MNIIYNEDCLEGMKQIPNGSVNMILCDLPYGITKNKWDSIIPLGCLWKEYERIISDRGAIVLTGSQPFTSLLLSSNLRMFKYCWIWKKDTPTNFLNANYQPLKNYEDICVFSKGNASWSGRKNSMTYNPQGLIEVNKVNKRGSSGTNYMKSGKENIQKFTNYPTTVLNFCSDSDKTHPTQKPIALFEYLIRTYTNEGDIVLDNCMGSGTTAIACINTNRKYIGFEMNEEYYNKSIDRINNHFKNKDMFELVELMGEQQELVFDIRN